jgi:transcription initiation factor TFIID subunit 10
MSNPSSTLAGSSPNPPVAESSTANGHPSAPALANGNGHVANGDTPPNDPSQVLATRREEEAARKDRSLAEFLLMLDGYKPMVSCRIGQVDQAHWNQIPEEVTEYYLQRAGFDCSDPRLSAALIVSGV